MLRGKNNSTGIAVVEIYDLLLSVQSRLGNISSRGFVGTGDNALIGGFISGQQTGATGITVRGIGPFDVKISCQLRSISDLELRDANGGLLPPTTTGRIARTDSD